MATYYTPTRYPTVSPIAWNEEYEERERHSTVIVGVIVWLALIGLAARLLQLLYRNNRSNRGTTTRTANGSRLTQQESEPVPSSRQYQAFIASKIAEMNVEELMVLFSETFEKNGRQTQLKAFQILAGNPTTNVVASYNEDDDDDEDEDEDEEIQRHDNNQEDHPSIYLALESVRSILQSQRASHSRNKRDTDSDDGSGIHQKQQQQVSKISTRRLAHPGDSRKKIVRGYCVICLEDMSCGQMVVWSETKSCKHIYHKECLVSFLAHNKRQQIERQRQPQQTPDNNPCPTCRQPFVTVCSIVPSQNKNANYTATERASNQTFGG